MAALKNIFVIGEIGVGKSSVINLITGTNVAKTSDGACRGTFGVEKHIYKNIVLWDTMGYNDVNEANPTAILGNLAKLVLDVNNGGISLILFIMKKGRITKAAKTNYDYFVKTVCENKVPVLLLVTHCELESPPEGWYDTQTDIFGKNEMAFAGTVCGSAIDLENPKLNKTLIPVFTSIRDETQKSIRNSLEALQLPTPWKPDSFAGWAPKVFWGALLFCGFAGSVLIAAVPTLRDALGSAATEAIKLFAETMSTR